MRLLLVTLVLALALSVGLWLAGVVPFNGYTFALHVTSIYIGVAGVLAWQLEEGVDREPPHSDGQHRLG